MNVAIMIHAKNISDQKANAREFASIIEKAYKDFSETSLVQESGLRCLITILNDDILNEWKKAGIAFDKGKDFITIRGGLFHVALIDAKYGLISLQE